MACDACARRLTSVLTKTEGVADARVDLAAKEATITFDPESTGESRLRERIRGAGFRPGESGG